ncbi:MAG: YtxH domain-containing protein [Bacteroidales bacterium]|nr:YtxH domain-containing protein [Bacteroidales bacterium]
MANNSFFGFLAGAAIGALAAAYLLSDKGKEDAERLKQAAGDIAEKAKNKAGEVADSAMDAVSRGLDAIEDALNKKSAAGSNAGGVETDDSAEAAL